MEFDESSVKVDPDVFYSHKGIVYRLAGETEVTDVSFTSDAVVVFHRPNYKDYPTSVRVYSRKGIDRDYYPPKSVVIGKPLTVLSGLCSGKLTAVNELIDSSPYGDGDDKIAYHMLNGFRGHDGRIEDTFPNIPFIRSEKSGTLVSLLEESERILSRAVGNVGIIAVQANGVVVR